MVQLSDMVTDFIKKRGLFVCYLGLRYRLSPSHFSSNLKPASISCIASSGVFAVLHIHSVSVCCGVMALR